MICSKVFGKHFCFPLTLLDLLDIVYQENPKCQAFFEKYFQISSYFQIFHKFLRVTIPGRGTNGWLKSSSIYERIRQNIFGETSKIAAQAFAKGVTDTKALPIKEPIVSVGE